VLSMFLLALPALAKDTPLQVLDWPETGTPVLRFTFSKFKPLERGGALHGYVTDMMAQNLSGKPIVGAQFSLFLYDKNKVRVGEDVFSLDQVSPGETVKLQTTVVASGMPLSVSVQQAVKAVKTVSLPVNSVPQGAQLKVDGTDAGETPKIVKLELGKHTLSFSKEGFAPGNYPMDIGADDVSGGSVSYELGTAAFDSVELRDGSVLTGDLVSITGMDVVIRVAGVEQHLDRNKIKRVLFTHRQAPIPSLPPVAAPNP
jgi:hypothetical protein